MATERRDVTPPLVGATTQRPEPPPVVVLHPDASREAAYLEWAYKRHRNAAAVGKALGIPPRTAQHWVNEDGWLARADREARELGAGVRAAASVALYGAVTDAVVALAKIARGEGDHRETLDKDGNPITVYDPVPFQARVNAANSILERTGLAGAKRHIFEVDPQPTPEESDRTDYGALPMSELIERQRRMLEKGA